MAIMDANSDSNQYQYIQDTSLASLDSKTSPLAMLVRTCSQIGADPPMAAAAKSKKQLAATAPASATPTADRPHSASPAYAAKLHHNHRNLNNNYMDEPPKPAAKLNFKPYENTVLTPSTTPPAAHQNHTARLHHYVNNNNEEDARPKSNSSEENGHGKKRKSSSPRDDCPQQPRPHKSSRRSSSSASSTESSAAAAAAAGYDPSADPVIRSGLEVMHGTKSFCPPPPPPPQLSMAAAHSPYGPAAADALAAFRHTYLPGGPPWIPAAVSLAAAAAAAAASKSSPTAVDCKDPLCGGSAVGCGQQQQHAAAAFAFASQYHHPMMAVGGACPAGCTQCDHQRYLTSLMAAMPAAFYAAPPPLAAASARPYTCSWVIPGGGHSMQQSAAEAAAVPTLCGKSFGTSDELLQHIRTHTAGVSAAMPGSPVSPTSFAAYGSGGHLSRHLFHHHHHPSAVAAYGKPSPPLSVIPPYGAFNVPTAAYGYPPPTSVAAAAAAAAAAYHHQLLYTPRGGGAGDTSAAAAAATVSR